MDSQKSGKLRSGRREERKEARRREGKVQRRVFKALDQRIPFPLEGNL
jgi:hypothetical protein